MEQCEVEASLVEVVSELQIESDELPVAENVTEVENNPGNLEAVPVSLVEATDSQADTETVDTCNIVNSDEKTESVCTDIVLPTSDIEASVDTEKCQLSLTTDTDNSSESAPCRAKAGRGYQENRRSKKPASSSASSPSEKAKASSTSSGIKPEYHSSGAKTEDKRKVTGERQAKGDISETHQRSVKGKDIGKQDTKPTCDGDPPTSTPIVTGGQDDRLDKEKGKQAASTIRQAPSQSEKRGSQSNRGNSSQNVIDVVSSKALSANELETQWKLEADKQKKQQEEEEAARLIAEQKEKELAEQQRIKEEEIKALQDFITETRERIESKATLREQNIKAAENRPDESFFVKLDSNLKRNTAFVKKLRNLTETQKDSLVKDFNSLNLTMYVGEMVDAIVEAKLKMTDVSCALTLCSLIHQRYAEFNGMFLEGWHKILLTKKDDKVPNPSKLRVDLRLFADLIAIGVFTEKEGLQLLANQLTLLTTNDREEHANLSIILSFCKHCGDDYAGLMPRKFRLLAEKYNMEIPRSQLLKVDRQKACRNLLRDYYQSLCKHLLRDCRELRGIEKQNRRILQTKGELSSERKEMYESTQNNFQKLLQNSQALADLLDEDLPNLPEEDVKSELDGVGMDAFCGPKSGQETQTEGETSLYDDDDTKQFYESLPDLKAIVPAILYKDSEQASSSTSSGQGATTEGVDDLDEDDMALLAETAEEDESKDTSESTKLAATTEGTATAAPAAAAAGAESKKHDNKKDDDVLPDVDSIVAADVEDDDTDVAGSMKVLIETFLSNLPNCVNRELIDKAAVDFCMNLNTKANRKKLVRALFYVHRSRIDLLPFYARFVASLDPCMPSIATDLCTMLKTDFRIHVRKKDQINIESKLKTVRFIGELVKFKVFPKSEALNCLKTLLFDFTHHNIEMACALLETCGRCLYRTPESRQRARVYLDVMMRKKAALHLDARYATMIENAFFYSNPPETRQETKVQRPPMQEYICRLLFKELSKTTVERVLRQMRKLNWDDVEVRNFATKCLAQIWNIRYNNVHCCANLLAGLAPYEESVSIHVIDAVLEEIRLGLEVNHPKYNQHRVSAVRYLGELYNYRMVESKVIFQTLYLFITFGVTFDESVPSTFDPPEHLFRIRLICVLLETCGQFFDRGSSKKKLDCFLVYFQRYYWFKKKHPIWTLEHPFPREVDYVVYDTLESLRPKLHICTSWEEASQAAEALDKEFAAKLAELIKPEDKSTGANQPGALTSIQETDEQETGLSQSQVMGGSCTQEDSDEQQHSLSQSQKGEDGGDDEDRRPRRTLDDEQEDLESGDDEGAIENMDDGIDDKLACNVELKVIHCAEDDDFMAALDKMMSETLQARSQEVVKIPVVDIAVPVHAKSSQKTKPPPQPAMLNILSSSSSAVGAQPTEASQEDEIGPTDNSIPFTLLMKKGNKQQLTTVNVPVNETFAAKFKEQQELEKMEKERMKRVVLNIHERQEEEDYQEMVAQLSRQLPFNVTNVNRDRRVPYQHPKGAPDADVIFGSKKR